MFRQKLKITSVVFKKEKRNNFGNDAYIYKSRTVSGRPVTISLISIFTLNDALCTRTYIVLRVNIIRRYLYVETSVTRACTAIIEQEKMLINVNVRDGTILQYYYNNILSTLMCNLVRAT